MYLVGYRKDLGIHSESAVLLIETPVICFKTRNKVRCGVVSLEGWLWEVVLEVVKQSGLYLGWEMY